MNPMTVAGVLGMLVGGLLAGDHKDVGLDSPAVGVLVFGLGFMTALNGYFRDDPVKDERTGGKRVKSASI